jgi:hypothetical protein
MALPKHRKSAGARDGIDALGDKTFSGRMPRLQARCSYSTPYSGCRQHLVRGRDPEKERQQRFVLLAGVTRSYRAVRGRPDDHRLNQTHIPDSRSWSR